MTTLDRDRLVLATTVATTSYVFFGTLAEQQRGVIPLLTGRIPVRTRTSPRTQVGFFAAFLPRAGIPIVAASNISMFLAFYTAYAHPTQLIRRLGFASGISSLLLAPLTIGQGLLKINSELLAVAKLEDRQIDEKADRIDSLIKTWEKKHVWRFISYTGAWVASFIALVLDGTI